MRVLNYAPGPLSTDMYDEICRTCGDEKIAQMFNASKEEVSATTRILEIFACEIRNLGRKSPEYRSRNLVSKVH